MIAHDKTRIVTEWNDLRASMRRPMPVLTPLAERYSQAIRPYLYFIALVLAALGLVLLLASADPASAAETPATQPVTIVRVTGADPLVYVWLKDNRALIVSPPRKAPEITVGPARIDLTSRRLLQNGVSYKIDQVVTPKKPQGKP